MPLFDNCLIYGAEPQELNISIAEFADMQKGELSQSGFSKDNGGFLCCNDGISSLKMYDFFWLQLRPVLQKFELMLELINYEYTM